MMTDVNIAEDCVGADDVAVLLLCVDRAGVGRYTRLNRRNPLAPSGGRFGAAASRPAV